MGEVVGAGVTMSQRSGGVLQRAAQRKARDATETVCFFFVWVWVWVWV